jgi:hypothetical protein
MVVSMTLFVPALMVLCSEIQNWLPVEEVIPSSGKEEEVATTNEHLQYSLATKPAHLQPLSLEWAVSFVAVHLFVMVAFGASYFPLSLSFQALMLLPPIYVFITSARRKTLLASQKWYSLTWIGYWAGLSGLAKFLMWIRFESWGQAAFVCAFFYGLFSLALGAVGFIYPVGDLVKSKLEMCMKDEFKGQTLFGGNNDQSEEEEEDEEEEGEEEQTKIIETISEVESKN